MESMTEKWLRIIQDSTQALGKMRRRHAELAATIAEIGAAVQRGDPRRAAEVSEMLVEKEDLRDRIGKMEFVLKESQSSLSHEREDARQSEIDQLFARMAQRRERIIELSRQLALELGELQGNDREEGTRLVEPVVSPTQQRFIELLSPLLPFEGPWYGAHRELPCGYENVIKIPAFVKL